MMTLNEQIAKDMLLFWGLGLRAIVSTDWRLPLYLIYKVLDILFERIACLLLISP